MVASLRHGPSYVQRTYSVPRLGCCFGIVSHDATFADARTFVSPDRRFVLVFVGEHFPVDSTSEIEQLLSRASDHDGFLRELNGWFAGLLIDLEENRVLVFNDRFGVSRIYYTATDDAFAFASEAKALLALRPSTRALNPAALGEFFGAGAVLGDHTLFHDVFTLPGGSAWSVEPGGQFRKHRYFMPAELEPQQVLGEDEFGAALAATLSRVVPRYLRGSHPIGLSLTGGLDTRGIVAFAPALSTYRAYTYGGMFRETFDVRVARQVAHACGCQHEVLSLGDEFLGRFPQLAEETVWITDGTLDVAGSHEIYLSRRAREIAPIRLTGNYGSELLRGISTFKPLRLPPSLFDPGFQPLVNAGEHALAAAKNVHPVTFTVFEEIPRHLYGRLAAAQSELTVRTPYMDNEVVSLAYRAPRNLSLQRRLWQRMIARHNPALGAIPTDRGLGGREQSLAGRWRRLNRYLTFKAEWYYESGMPGWAAWLDARLGRGRRPPWPVGTHKIENYRRWFRDELHPWLSGELHDTSAMPFLSRPAVRETIAAHGAGAENFTAELSRLLTIALVTRTLLNANVLERIRGATSDTPAPVELDRGLTGASVLNLSQPL